MSDFKDYLGDSVYVEIERGMVKLTTNNGHDDDPRNVVYMEEAVLRSFLEWVERIRAATYDPNQDPQAVERHEQEMRGGQ